MDLRDNGTGTGFDWLLHSLNLPVILEPMWSGSLPFPLWHQVTARANWVTFVTPIVNGSEATIDVNHPLEVSGNEFG